MSEIQSSASDYRRMYEAMRDGIAAIDALEQENAALTVRIAELEEGLRAIATRDQDDRPLPSDSDSPFDWRRRSMWQEERARALLTPPPPAATPESGTAAGASA